MNLSQKTIISTTVGKNPIRNRISLIINKRVGNAVLGYLKNDRIILVCFQGKPFNIIVIQTYALTTNAEEAKVDEFCDDVQDLLELTPKMMSFSS